MGQDALNKSVEFMLQAALVDTGMYQEGWSLSEKRPRSPFKNAAGYLVTTVDLDFVRKKPKDSLGRTASQLETIKQALGVAGASKDKFAIYPWELTDPSEEIPDELIEPSIVSEDEGGEIDAESEAQAALADGSETIYDVSDYRPPEHLIGKSNREIEESEEFRGLYNLGPQIRIAVDALNMAIRSEFEWCSHILFQGSPSGGKSGLFAGFKKLVGEGGYLSLITPQLSKAGFEYLYLVKYRGKYHRVLFLEEVEKLGADALLALLPVMAEPHEVTKHQFRNHDRVPVKLLVIATANDIRKLRAMHGGALYSRFTTKIFVPRPDDPTMKRILNREVGVLNGNPRWVEKVMTLKNALGAKDPRTIISFLAGGQRLETHAYQDDLEVILAQMDEARRSAQAGDGWDDALPEDEGGSYEKSLATFINMINGKKPKRRAKGQ
jgi:MoxR-like ATPase